MAEDRLVDLRHTVADNEQLQLFVREAAQQRYDEGYERGVHDRDAAAILAALVHVHEAAVICAMRHVRAV